MWKPCALAQNFRGQHAQEDSQGYTTSLMPMWSTEHRATSRLYPVVLAIITVLAAVEARGAKLRRENTLCFLASPSTPPAAVRSRESPLLTGTVYNTNRSQRCFARGRAPQCYSEHEMHSPRTSVERYRCVDGSTWLAGLAKTSRARSTRSGSSSARGGGVRLGRKADVGVPAVKQRREGRSYRYQQALRASDGLAENGTPSTCEDRWTRRSRTVGLLTRSLSATGRFFANQERGSGKFGEASRRRKNDRQTPAARGARAHAQTQTHTPAMAQADAQTPALASSVLSVPRHVAFVMDGNGRWAAERNMPRRAGHVEGARRAGEAVQACRELGVEFVTLYAFSTENWNRPAAEVSFLMELMEKTLLEQRDELRRSGIRLKVIGELHRLPTRLRSVLEDIQRDGTASETEAVAQGDEVSGRGGEDARFDRAYTSGASPATVPASEKAEAMAACDHEGPVRGSRVLRSVVDRVHGTGNGIISGAGVSDEGQQHTLLRPPPPDAACSEATSMTLCLAISYGGRAEVAAAARELVTQAIAGTLDPNKIDEEVLGRQLSTARLGIPDPDLVVRTSGESRLSNLLLWQTAYAELCVVTKTWPEFRRADLVDAFREFGRRNRRYGNTAEQANAV